MGVEVARTCLHWSRSIIIPQSPSSSQTLASAISSPYSKRRSRSSSSETGLLVCRYVQRLDQSALFGPQLSKQLHRDYYPNPRIQHAFVRKTFSTSLYAFNSESESESRDSRDGFVDPPWEEDERKLQWRDGFRDAGESAYCSVKKAFSSMVFIIRELQSFTIQMREILFCEDLKGILVRVQKEMHASFVWLFQQVFSHTPTLMVYVMILLANFTVYSMASNTSLAATPPPAAAYQETAGIINIQAQRSHKFDQSYIKKLSVLSSSSGKTTSIGGNNGGSGKIRPVASGTDGDGGFEFDRMYQSSSFGTTREAESVSGQVDGEEELSLWDSIVDEASQMHVTDESLDHETMKRFVSPATAKIEADDHAAADYFKTERFYQTVLAQEPNNPLLLANYAQFLYIVAHDYDRAEEYFKRAIAAEPPDAESFSKYGNFLWRARNDLWAAEETFLEAISVDPTNSYYAANYAHFLWNTGGEDTCFPLSSPDTIQEA